MRKSYSYRLYPTVEQSCLMDTHFNACRLVYNLGLETKKYAYTNYGKSISYYDLKKQLPELKKDNVWLYEVCSQALQMSLKNLDDAFVNFFKGNCNFPKYKTKSKSKKSFKNPNGLLVKIKGNKICFPRFMEGVRFVQDRVFDGVIKSSTVSCTATGKYYISLLVETGAKMQPKVPTDSAIGIDLGIKDFIVTSEGVKYENPKHLKNNLQRLKVLQRRLSKKKKGSANRDKARHKVALLHEKIANCRKDFLHKLSSQLVNNHDCIVMEDLNVKGMLKNHKLAQSISDVSWSEFERQLKYKCDWYGKTLYQIPRFEPSTKTCNNCKSINDTLTLADREWVCANCGTLHDRDINAAKNIKDYFIKHSPKAIRVEPVESSTLVGAVKQEGVITSKQQKHGIKD